jgi:MFS family permease
MQGQDWGWSSPVVLALFPVAAVLFVLFGRVERAEPAPLVDLAMVRGAALAANAVGAAAQFAITGVTVVAAIYLQNVLGYSPVDAGLRLLPLTVPALFGSPAAGRLLEHFSARTLAAAGMALMAAGLLATGIGADVSDTFGALVPGFIVFGTGFAVSYTVMTTLVMASAPAVDRGMASGVYNTARNVGATLGVAAMGAILVALDPAGLSPSAAEGRGQFDHAFAVTFYVTAALLAVGAVVAATALPRGSGPADG